MRFFSGCFFAFFLMFAFIYSFQKSSSTTTLIDNIVFQRDVSVLTDSDLVQSQVQSLLPKSNSNLWWRINLDRISSSIKQLPMVEDVAITPCKLLSCYRVNIKEASPSYIYDGGNGNWLVDKKGVFVLPVNGSDVEKYFSNTIKVKDSLYKSNSPEYLNSRIRYIEKFILELSSNIDYKISRVDFNRNGEAIVRFVNMEADIVFSNYEQNYSNIEKESARLTYVLSELLKSDSKFKIIDLTLNSQAIVKL